MGPVNKAKVHLLENDDVASILEPARRPNALTGTKVICTLGPACRDVKVLEKLLLAGMSCARVDLTYAPIAYHRQSLKNLAAAVEKTGRLCGIILDTFGRELAIRREQYLNESGWPELKGSFAIEAGDEVVVTTDENAQASASCLPITYKQFASICQPRDQLFIGRYLANGSDTSSLYLEVKEVRGGDVVCKAINDAVLEGMLTVIHSQAAVDGMSHWQSHLPLLTAGDIEAIQTLGSEFEIDFISLTYTGDAGDIATVRQLLDANNMSHVKVMAKIENRQALDNFAEIAAAADAIVLSRGNLGLDVAPEKMAAVQKMAITQCNQLGKPVIITRLVDTMVTTPRCTRAEATDVANAVLDGVDGLLLGAETLRGKYALETVTTVLSICGQAEAVFDHAHHFDSLLEVALQESLGMATVESMDSLDSAALTEGSRPAPRASSFGNLPRVASNAPLASGGPSLGVPHMSRVEAMASTAVTSADKLAARLLIVFANSGRTASLVAKYRPSMPILVLVRPKAAANAGLAGRTLARQMEIVRGTVPIVGTVTASVPDDLAKLLNLAVERGLAAEDDRVVALMCGSQGEDMVLQSFMVPGKGKNFSQLPQGSVADLVALAGK